MAYVLDVIEELAAAAYEHGVRTISVSQVERELRNVGECSERNVEAVCQTLTDLDYVVTTIRKTDRVKTWQICFCLLMAVLVRSERRKSSLVRAVQHPTAQLALPEVAFRSTPFLTL